MLPRALAEKVKRMIEVTDDQAVLKGVYFNPFFAGKLKEKVPELEEAGIVIIQTNVESDSGLLVEANLQASNGMTLSLGSVTLNGKDIAVTGALATIETVVSFVQNNAKQTL